MINISNCFPSKRYYLMEFIFITHDQMMLNNEKICHIQKDTHIFCKFLHNCLKIVSKLCSEHDRYFTETLSRNCISTIWDAGTPWFELGFYLWPEDIKHPLQRIQQNAQLKCKNRFSNLNIMYKYIGNHEVKEVTQTSSGTV